MQGEAITLVTPSDREIAWSRRFAAPRHLVFDAMTKPELLRRWLLGPPGWAMTVCEIDLRVGGAYRWVWVHPEQGELGLRGLYKEIAKPEKIVNTECYDQSWYAGEAQGTAIFVEAGGKTTLTTTMLYESRAARDMALQSPMDDGLNAGYAALDAFLAEIKEGAK